LELRPVFLLQRGDVENYFIFGVPYKWEVGSINQANFQLNQL